MREILFRGKLEYDSFTTDKAGDRVYGGFALKLGIEQGITIPYADDLWVHHVIPGTVGEYTGLEYRKGKKIFEGDIIKFHWERDKPDKRGTVVYRGSEFLAKSEFGGLTFMRFIDDRTEIIGSIHDNPDLLLKEVI
jgi:hypothetical protein